MTDKPDKPDNIVRFPGSKPSLKNLIEDAVENFPNISAAVIVFFDESNNGELHTSFFANKQEIAAAGARLIYLAGRDESLRDLDV